MIAAFMVAIFSLASPVDAQVLSYADENPSVFANMPVPITNAGPGSVFLNVTLNPMTLANAEAGGTPTLNVGSPSTFVYMSFSTQGMGGSAVNDLHFSVDGGANVSLNLALYGVGSLPTYFGVFNSVTIATGTPIGGTQANETTVYNLRLSGLTDHQVNWTIGNTAAETYTGTTAFHIVAVPEPGTTAIGVLGGLALLGMTVIRHRSAAYAHS